MTDKILYSILGVAFVACLVAVLAASSPVKFVLVPLSQTAAIAGSDSGLVAHYTFDEGSGTTVADAANGNNGAIESEPNWTSGKIGSGALTFDGADDRVVVADTSGNSVTGPITLSGWFKISTAPGSYSKALIAKKNSFSLSISGSGATAIVMGIRGQTTSETFMLTVPTYKNDDWHHLVGVFDGDVMKLYLDGSQRGTKDTTRTSIDNTAEPLVLGTFNGSLDDVRIYNRALTDDEVVELYGSTPAPVNQTPSSNQTPSDTTTNTSTTTNTGSQTPPQNQPSTPTTEQQLPIIRTPAPAPVSWKAPIGIPEPDFGIRETHFMYQLKEDETCSSHPNKCFDFGKGLEPYRDAGAGPYTHYIDKNSSAATDTNNPYGTSVKPRISIPSAPSAGSVIEIHGGPYGGRAFYITPQGGTKERPIFYRGPSSNDKPIFEKMSSFMIRGPYIIVENIRFNGIGPDIRKTAATEQVHHISFRHNESYGSNIGAVTGCFTCSFTTNDVVFYNNISRSTDVDALFAAPDTLERDSMGFGIMRNSSYVWIVDNDISGSGGDAVGAGHAANYTAHHYFVGRNKMYNTGENAVDLKEVNYIVVSENKMYNFRGPSAGSDGTAVVVHYGPQRAPMNTWFLYNEIYDSTEKGIQVGGSMPHDVYFIGNEVHDITNPSKNAWGYMSWATNRVYLVGNTFYNVDNGIGSQSTGKTAGIIAKNNTIGPLTTTNGYHLKLDDRSYQSVSQFSNNLFVPSTKIGWSVLYTTVNDFFTKTGQCSGCTTGEVGADVPADREIMNELNKKFEDTFGIDISGGARVPRSEVENPLPPITQPPQTPITPPVEIPPVTIPPASNLPVVETPIVQQPSQTPERITTNSTSTRSLTIPYTPPVKSITPGVANIPPARTISLPPRTSVTPTITGTASKPTLTERVTTAVSSLVTPRKASTMPDVIFSTTTPFEVYEPKGFRILNFLLGLFDRVESSVTSAVSTITNLFRMPVSEE